MIKMTVDVRIIKRSLPLSMSFSALIRLGLIQPFPVTFLLKFGKSAREPGIGWAISIDGVNTLICNLNHFATLSQSVIFIAVSSSHCRFYTVSDPSKSENCNKNKMSNDNRCPDNKAELTSLDVFQCIDPSRSHLTFHCHILVEVGKESERTRHRLRNFHWWSQHTHLQFEPFRKSFPFGNIHLRICFSLQTLHSQWSWKIRKLQQE